MRRLRPLEAIFERRQLFWPIEIDEEGRRVTKINLGAVQSGLPFLHPMPALGEGAVCDYCAARGLCRKDFWND